MYSFLPTNIALVENILLHVGIFSLLEYRRNENGGGGGKKGKEERKEKQEIEYNLITRGVNNRDKKNDSL